VRAELIEHVGGNPTPPMRALVEQAAQLRVRIALMDRKFATDGKQTDHDSRTYLAWVGTLGRLMERLERMRASKPTKSPQERLAETIRAEMEQTTVPKLAA
jgi:hypothetical protein